ncbi:MAG TPA: serine/threonine-protein kinase [Steroidobacteraceae bacterium]
MMAVSQPQRVRLSPEQAAELDALLEPLLDLPSAERLRALELRSIADPAVRAEAESLLRADQASSGFLENPVTLTPTPAEPPDEREVGMELGSWRILKIVGRGGMGIVCEAKRIAGDFEQRAAIKLLRRGATGTAQRFEFERRILARLEHPGIARLLDGGVAADGRPYMVMEFVDGQPITDHCRLGSLSLVDRLNLFIQVCDAVAYAHRRLIVHRDLKPGNVLIDGDGRVKLLDFGIAKLLDASDSQLTQAVMVVLSPLCAAPEQLTGADITTQTDVYALGLMLYELLSGHHPWIQDDATNLRELRELQLRPLPSPSRQLTTSETQIDPRALRGDLEAVLNKSLRPEPAQRYATVEALKQDIERYLRGDPVQAREGARFYVLRRVLRQYRWFAIGIATIVISLTVGLGLAAWQAKQAALQRDAARREAAREEAVRYNLTRMFRSAISDTTNGTAPTAKSMIDVSAQRVLNEYRDNPEVGGPLVLTLADLYGALEDAAGAGALLEGFVSQAGPKTDPAVLADARQKLANVELLQGHLDRAGELLTQAQDYWARVPRANAEEQLEGLVTQAQLQRARNDFAGAANTARAAITQRIALSGHDNRETAILFNSLALSLTNSNQLHEALAAYGEATAIYRALNQQDGLDAQVIRGNTGTLEMRLGKLREAEADMRGAFEQERALAGNSAAVAAAEAYYARLLTLTDRADQAIPLLRDAADLGSRYTSPNSPLTLQARLFLGEAQIAHGERDAARITLLAARDGTGGPGKSVQVLRLRIDTAVARLDAATGSFERAQTSLAQTVQSLRALGAPAEGALAQALFDAGDAALRAQDSQKASVLLRESVAVREHLIDPQWELALARERLAESISAQQPANAALLLRPAIELLTVQLGPKHSETQRARQALASLSGA